MSAYEILKRLAPYTLFIRHMVHTEYECSCLEETTCEACDEHALFEELDAILKKAGDYVF